MKSFRSSLGGFSTIMIAMLLCSMFFLNSAFAKSGETIRVGIFKLGNFQYFDDTDTPRGYNIDYLDKISETTHWNYQYVKCNNWVEATALLEKGEIDLLAPAQHTPQLDSKFSYSVYRMGVEFAAIYCLNSRDDLVYEDFNAMAGLKFGAVQESSFTRNFIKFAQEKGFKPNISYYNNTTEIFAALNAGEVDAIVTNIMFATDNVKTLGRFAPTPVYYITAPGKETLLRELENAISEIELNNPTFAAGLIRKHFPQYNNSKFSYAEYQYIKSLPEITIGYSNNRSPLTYTKNGEFNGISRDILDKISAISGIKFRYVELPAERVSYEKMQELGIDAVADIRYNSLSSSLKQVRLSHPYFLSEAVFVADKKLNFDEEANLKVAIVDESGTFPKMIKTHYPNFEVVRYDSIDKCFVAVKDGKADLLLLNRYSVEANITNPHYDNLMILPTQSMRDEFCLASMLYANDNSDLGRLLSDDRFITVINKAIEQLSPREINMIIANRTAENLYDYTPADFFYEYRYFIFPGTLLIVVCFWLMARSRRLKMLKNEELAKKNEQLMEAVNQADQANKAKSLFLSRMSHEIRTPMNAIVGIVTIAKTHLQEPLKVDEYLDKIRTSSKVLLNIINDVLDMSAIESAKLKIAHEKFDLRELLSAVSAMYYAQCKSKGITFELVSAKVNEEILWGDSLRVNQILLNLISNAFKFTDPGGKIVVTVEESAKKKDKVFLKIIVTDTGIGMSEDMQKRLFKSFEQENATTAQKYGGSGLGMSITANIVDLMHGAINVKSKKGEGTTFTVELPFDVAEDMPRIQKENLQDIRALIVDDDKNTLEYTSIIMKRIGLKYDIAANGEKAMEMIAAAQSQGGYQICFVDWKMSGLSGIDVTRQIREQYSKDTIIIIVSAYDLSEVEDEAKAAGANMFIPKPLFQSTVFNLLMSLNGGKLVNMTADEDEFDFQGIKVLLAEDNELNREIAIELLKMVNIEAECAEDGVIAVQKFTEAPAGTYKAILMDIQMPNLNGYEAAKQIRSSSHPEAESIPIIAMTANAFTEDIAEALSAGMNDHVAKPIDNDVLYRTISKYVNKK